MSIFDPFGAAAIAAERRSAGRARTPSLRSSRGLPALCRNTPAIVTHVSHKGIHFAGFRNACRMFLIGAGRIGHYLLALERVNEYFPGFVWRAVRLRPCLPLLQGGYISGERRAGE